MRTNQIIMNPYKLYKKTVLTRTSTQNSVSLNYSGFETNIHFQDGGWSQTNLRCVKPVAMLIGGYNVEEVSS